MTSTESPENNFFRARFDPSYLLSKVKKIFKRPVSGIFCQALEGDASDRSYFRVSFQSEANEKNQQSLIVMQLKDPVTESETDFTRILKFLRRIDLPAPELFHYDVPMGLLFLEDCGIRTLGDELDVFPKRKAKLYYQAVELLFDMQTRATHLIDSKCPAYHHKFDVKKLMWELDFMLDHYVKGLCESSLENFAKNEVREVLSPLCELLAEQRLYFTHRDYHSRNLMVNGNRLVLIDFQDARMGPCQYDLVSLLKDPYMQIDDSLLEELVNLYIRLKEKEEGQEVDREEFRRIFDGASLQRNLKVLGTFAYQSLKKNNHRYKGYIAPTLGYIRQTLNRRYNNSALQEALFKYIPGLDENEVIGP